MLGGLLFGAATSDDGAVVAGFPAHGQVRQCAMPDADSSLPDVLSMTGAWHTKGSHWTVAGRFAWGRAGSSVESCADGQKL